MKNNFRKTNHFWERAWERGYSQSEIDRLMKNVNKKISGKSIMIFGRNKLKDVGHEVSRTTHLLIVVQNNVLITMFEVPNLFDYLKVNLNRYSQIIF